MVVMPDKSKQIYIYIYIYTHIHMLRGQPSPTILYTDSLYR